MAAPPGRANRTRRLSNEGAASHEQRVGSHVAQTLQRPQRSRALVSALTHLYLQSHGASSRFHGLAACVGVAAALAGLTSDRHASGCGQQLAQKPQPLCRQLVTEKIDTCRVAAWPRQACDQGRALTGSSGDGEDDGDGLRVPTWPPMPGPVLRS